MTRIGKRSSARLAVHAVVLAAVVFLSAVMAEAQDTAAPEAPSSQIAVGSSEIDDEEIRDRIRAILGEMAGFEDVDVSVSSGVVTVSGEVIDAAAEETLRSVVNRVDGVVALENEVTQTADLEVRLAPAIERLRQRVERIAVNAPMFVLALLAFAIVFVAGWLLTSRFHFWERLAPNAFISDIYRTVARFLFAAVGLVVALDILNATALIGAVLGAAGLVGLAVGFAVRDTVENFIASVLLSLRQPFRPNDVVDINGDLGSVARLTSRATILISPDGNQIRIPNATVFKGRIVNYTRDPHRRFVFTLGVGPETDLAAALSRGTEALAGLPFVLADPPVSAWIEDVGESSILVTFAAWADQTRSDFLKARGEAIRVTKTALEAEGISLPEPTYRLKMETGGTDAGEPRAAVRPPSATLALEALPDAATPDHAGLATEKVLERERGSKDTSPDLLSDAREAE